MPLNVKTLSTQNIAQLAFDLGIEDVESESALSQEEVRLRSESAISLLKAKFRSDAEALEKYEVDKKAFDLAMEFAKTSKRQDQDNYYLPVPPVKPNTFGWAEDFFLLLNQGWNWRIAVYIAWEGGPKIGRWPKTQEQLATEVLGLTSDRQISDWRKKYPAIDQTIGIMQAMPLLSHRRDMYEALAISASNPSSKGAQDRKLGFALLGDYVPNIKIEDKRSSSDPMDMSDAELDEIIKLGGQ